MALTLQVIQDIYEMNMSFDDLSRQMHNYYESFILLLFTTKEHGELNKSMEKTLQHIYLKKLKSLKSIYSI